MSCLGEQGEAECLSERAVTQEVGLWAEVDVTKGAHVGVVAVGGGVGVLYCWHENC